MKAGGQQQMAAAQLRTLGWPSKGNLQFEPPSGELDPVYGVSASFELDARTEFLDGKAFVPPTELR
jgi:hypothetical protein